MLWKTLALLPAREVLRECRSRESGLFAHEVKGRQSAFGRNEIKSDKRFWREFAKRRLRSAFLYLLLFAGIVSFLLGERIEALLIATFLFVNVTLESVQEYHSAKATRLLRRFIVSRVTVRRAGDLVPIESREIVPGDMLLVDAGDRLAADIRFIQATNLSVDESVITGESAPVVKRTVALRHPTSEMHEAANIGFAGTVVVTGRGEGVVLATGRDTALGDAISTAEETAHESLFERELAHFSRFILRLVFLTLSIIFIANVIIRGESVGIGSLLVFSLALAVSVVPEALPVITTVSLSRGSLKLARHKVIVKRLSAIEDLGSIDVLCTDKTGTLTENALVVAGIKSRENAETLVWASAASHVVPNGRDPLRDPFDLAVWNALSAKSRKVVAELERLDVLPFDPVRRRNSILLETKSGEYTVVVRGAFEDIVALSTGQSKSERAEWLAWSRRQGQDGCRVLAVAVRTVDRRPKLSPNLEKGLYLVGLIAFHDPLKPTAAATIREAKALGIRVKILTGDSPEVAGAVAHAVGLIPHPGQVMTGDVFESLPLALQREAVNERAVFARVNPRQKFDIIKLIQEKHEVGFLGEGINDAPALKLSNVALVVQGASDVAREAADIVLLQRHLGTIIEGIRQGRTIFANIRKYLLITLTSNFGNFYSVALASLFLPFLPLLPIQILLLNLLSDFPMLALATDNVDHEELEKPRVHQVNSIILMATLLGIVSSFFDFMLFATFLDDGPATLQTAWFVMSVVTEVILIFSLRTRGLFFRTRRPATLLLSLALLVLSVVVVLPFTALGQNVFQFQQPSIQLLLLVLVLAAAYFVTTEMVKRFFNHSFDTRRLIHAKHNRALVV